MPFYRNKGDETMNLLYPYIRFFNTSPHGGACDFYIGNTLAVSKLGFGCLSPYMKVLSGNTMYKAAPGGRKGENSPRLIMSQKIGEVYTLCLIGKPNEPKFMAIKENTPRVNLEYGHLRICNLSPECGGFDVYADDNKILGDIKYGEISRYMEIRPSDYEISLVKNKKTAVNCGRFNLKPKKFNTVYIIGLENEIPNISCVFTTDAESYNGFYL